MTNEEKYKTPEERHEAFGRFCREYHNCGKGCNNCPASSKRGGCRFAWLALEAEEELLPCPFCGGEAESQSIPSFRNSHFVRCKICLSSVRGYDTKDNAIAAWNRRSR